MFSPFIRSLLHITRRYSMIGYSLHMSRVLIDYAIACIVMFLALVLFSSIGHTKSQLLDSLDPITQQSSKALPVTLQNNIIVSDDVIRLGDIFDNIDHHQERTIARAPSPGQQIVLPAQWLWRIAQNFNLQWAPSSNFDSTQVLRASQIVDSHDIEDAVQQELINQYPELQNGKWDITIDNRARNIHLPLETDIHIKVEQLKLNRQNHSFSAIVAINPNTRWARERRLRGNIYKLVEVWVPTRSIARGDIIDEKQLNLTYIQQHQLSPDSLLDIDDMVGMQAKRNLRTKQPIRHNDIEQPRLIKRGEAVDIFIHSGKMLLSTTGTALEDGTQNQNIRVRNVHSGKTIDAVAIAPGAVQVKFGRHFVQTQ